MAKKKRTVHEAAVAAGYARGYTAGKNREGKSHRVVTDALRRQADYWRDRYMALRDGREEPEALPAGATPEAEGATESA